MECDDFYCNYNNRNLKDDIEKLNKEVKKFHLSNNYIYESDALYLSEYFKNNSVLTHLDLENNNIENDVFIELLDSLKNNSVLTHLNVKNNKIGILGIKFLSSFLEKNNSLYSLNLSYNYVNSEIYSLVEALKKNNSLKVLNLEHTLLELDGIIKLSEVLQFNNLIFLNLARNDISDYEISFLANALKLNTSLNYLILSNNFIEDLGCMCLSEMLEINTTLHHLNLSSNMIKNEDIGYLDKMLKINTTLRELDISCNFIGNKSMIKIVKALNYSNLSVLYAKHNNINESIYKYFYNVLKYNISLLDLSINHKTNVFILDDTNVLCKFKYYRKTMESINANKTHNHVFDRKLIRIIIKNKIQWINKKEIHKMYPNYIKRNIVHVYGLFTRERNLYFKNKEDYISSSECLIYMLPFEILIIILQYLASSYIYKK